MTRAAKAKRGGARTANGYSFAERVLWSGWCALTRLLPIDMSRSGATHRLSVSGECTNLSCLHDPSDWHPRTGAKPYQLPAHWILSALATLRRRGLCEVTASNYGDKTVRQGWSALSASQSLAPPDFVIIDDLTVPMNGDELIGLTHMDSIHVSLETVDPELYAELHSGRNLDTVLHNMDRARALAQAQKIPVPEFVFDIEVTSRTVNELERIVRVGVEHGVRDFTFHGLYKGSTVRDELKVFNVLTLPKDELREALTSLEKAMALARDMGCKVHCDPKLYDGIRDELSKSPVLRAAQRAPATSSQTAAPVPPGMTRNCTLPWTYINICAHGQVRPCSEFRASIGNLRQESLAELLNGRKLRQLRKNLLMGNLNGHRCRHCTVMPTVPVRTFQRTMRGNLVLWGLRRRLLNLLRFFRRS
jgi:radical SAM protein with 4Fe4S-binding SPASM domain